MDDEPIFLVPDVTDYFGRDVYLDARDDPNFPRYDNGSLTFSVNITNDTTVTLFNTSETFCMSPVEYTVQLSNNGTDVFVATRKKFINVTRYIYTPASTFNHSNCTAVNVTSNATLVSNSSSTNSTNGTNASSTSSGSSYDFVIINGTVFNCSIPESNVSFIETIEVDDDFVAYVDYTTAADGEFAGNIRVM